MCVCVCEWVSSFCVSAGGCGAICCRFFQVSSSTMPAILLKDRMRTLERIAGVSRWRPCATRYENKKRQNSVIGQDPGKGAESARLARALSRWRRRRRRPPVAMATRPGPPIPPSAGCHGDAAGSPPSARPLVSRQRNVVARGRVSTRCSTTLVFIRRSLPRSHRMSA